MLSCEHLRQVKLYISLTLKLEFRKTVYLSAVCSIHRNDCRSQGTCTALEEELTLVEELTTHDSLSWIYVLKVPYPALELKDEDRENRGLKKKESR